MLNIKKWFKMEKEDTGIVFINWGRTDYETNKEIVLKKDSDAVFDDIFKSLPFRGWISINSTYVSFDKRIQQGECILYRNKMN